MNNDGADPENSRVHSRAFLPSNFAFRPGLRYIPPPPPPLLSSVPPASQSVSHLTSQPTLITSPPPKGSYFLIARPSCYSIPEINSPPLCYSYYLGVLELACPSKRTLYSAFFLTPPPHDLISGHTLQPGTGRAHRLQR